MTHSEIDPRTRSERVGQFLVPQTGNQSCPVRFRDSGWKLTHPKTDHPFGLETQNTLFAIFAMDVNTLRR
ncbi:hypothetical protein EUGRSUZ_C03712 [Eucalyptus grandis]|uniref:Uncharacterized protein n=2 Tax=Eucalyptus grandis TaxID=71139 RepID=A0ACC3LJ32_EUCGR|nr:hypothetical protein EUGRSUZ_C03712 [Eucalyptus grandis]